MIYALPLLAPLLLLIASAISFLNPGLRPRFALKTAQAAALGSILVVIGSAAVL